MIVGIDVSKKSFDVCWVEAGQVVHKHYEYTETGMRALLADTPEQAHYVMEATGVYHSRLALYLYQSDRAVSVVNPLVIKRFGQMKLRRAKTDRADAQLICQYGEAHSPKRWQPTSQVIQELMQAHSWLDDLIRERTRLMNRREALMHQGHVNPFVEEQMKKQSSHLNDQITNCEQHLEQVVKKHFALLYERLISIHSIGPKTALELILVTAGFTRFEHVKTLSAYTGLSPTTYQSGTSIQGPGHIAKLGQGRLRQLLYMCSWTARRRNAACAKLYKRLHAAGKPAKVISIAIANKLLRQAYAVATKNEMYSEKYA